MRILHLNEILKGEGQAFYFWNNNFELWVRVMAWTYVPTTWGWFLVHVRNTAHARPQSKKWVEKTKSSEVELSFLHHSIRFDELIISDWSDVKIEGE